MSLIVFHALCTVCAVSLALFLIWLQLPVLFFVVIMTMHLSYTLLNRKLRMQGGVQDTNATLVN